MSERFVLFISAEENVAAGVEAVLRERTEIRPEANRPEANRPEVTRPEVTRPEGNRPEVTRMEVTRVQALLDGLRALQDGSFDLIVSDLFLPDGQGLGTLAHLRQHAPQTPVIVLCHPRDRDTAVQAVRKGAFDFFCYDDPDPSNLRRSIDGAMKHVAAPETEKQAAERRNNARFPCRLAVSYQTLEHPILSGQGTSETLNISSKGILFTSNEKFHAGQLVQVSLDWPARLEKQIPLKLVAEGRIVRNSNGQTAMTIDKYEFRTRRIAKPASGDAASGGAAFANKNTPSHPSEAALKNLTQPGTAAGRKTNGTAVRRPV
jgi:CheY-like chemotaxis protein